MHSQGQSPFDNGLDQKFPNVQDQYVRRPQEPSEFQIREQRIRDPDVRDSLPNPDVKDSLPAPQIRDPLPDPAQPGGPRMGHIN